MTTFKDIEHNAKRELEEEEISLKTGVLKERIQEIKEAEKTLKVLRAQYEELLSKDLDEIDVDY